ncbi:MAG: type II secretion system inner membrane protein GspF [Gammaproteobacteria bacterium]
MGAFEFTALDEGGRERKGVLEADTPRQIRQQCLPVEEALQTLSRQTEKPRLKSLLMAVRSRVMEGHALATAFEDFPHVFPDLYRATVAAGEQSGYLDAVLERLADYTESRQTLQQKTMLALIYPLIVMGVSLLVVVFLMVYVVPEIVQVFEGIGQKLPLLTRSLIATSDFIRDNGIVLLVGIAAAVAALRALLRRSGPKRQLHRILLGLPMIGRLVRGLNTARFARTLSILTGSGVPVLEALRISATVVGNLPMRAAVEEGARRVREGAALHTALEHSGYFPPMTVHLIASGESSGKLDEMLERAAASQEREMEVLVTTITELFGPLLILVMGGIVLVIVLAILLPIFDLNQLVK